MSGRYILNEIGVAIIRNNPPHSSIEIVASAPTHTGKAIVFFNWIVTWEQISSGDVFSMIHFPSKSSVLLMLNNNARND